MLQSTLIAHIRGEFLDHPGIVLTLSQAMSRWSLDRHTGSHALTALTDEGFLTCINGLYFRTDVPIPLFKVPLSPANRTARWGHWSPAAGTAARLEPG